MNSFINEDFLLETETARRLYHEYAKGLPIIDYHNHLPPDQIAADHTFENITQVWLQGDHYKWRAMRAYGIDENYITGNASDKEKFLKWAEVVPYTLRNPLYHWTHLELKNPFGINELLSPENAETIYEETSGQLRKQFSVQHLLKHFNVEVVCTTDDPIDNLEYHQQHAKSSSDIRMYPAFRPDQVLKADQLNQLRKYLDTLSSVSGVEINSFRAMIDAIKVRHDYFAENGCTISDHGLNQIFPVDFTDAEVASIFEKILAGKELDQTEYQKYHTATLYHLALLDHEKGWIQQYHLGALRDTNSRLLSELGPDTGFDSIGDFQQAEGLAMFLDRLERANSLAKTILYNLNPADNEVFATMIGNYSDGSVKGKMQWGSGWWFLDQKDGMEKQMEALSNMGLLSCFIGMLTDSRSFLSFSRHEYFRRILCNVFGNDIEKGLLPEDIQWTGKIIEDICYHNAKSYFRF